MSKIHARIRIRLVSPVNIRATAALMKTVRGDGPDYWEAKLITRTNEGKVDIDRYTSTDKQTAINQAYRSLEIQRINEWFNQFYTEQYELNEAVLEEHEEAMKVFLTSMEKVQSGEYSREQFIDLWKTRMEWFQKLGGFLPPPTNREHVLVSEPVPKKWSFWDWFK